MVTCTGKSLIPINLQVYQNFMNSVVPQDKLPEFNIKLDARAKVKSVFAKLEGVDLTLYTGAIVSMGLQKFSELDAIDSLFMLLTIYGVKKAGAGENFEIKTTDQGISAIKTDNDFQVLSGKLHFFMEKFRPLNEKAMYAEPVQTTNESVSEKPDVAFGAGNDVTYTATAPVNSQPEPVKETKSKTKESPFKGVPLKDVPQIEVPAGLDLRMV